MRTTRLLIASVLAVAVLASGLALPAYAEGTPGLAEARRRANAAAQELSDVQTRLGELEADIAQASAEAESAQAELDRLRGDVQQIALRRYTQADQVPLFQVEDINEHERAKVLVRAVTRENVDAIDQYRATSERLSRSQATLDDARSEQEQRLADLEASQQRLSAELNRLEALERERLAAEQRRREEEARRAAEEEARRRAEAEAEQLRRQQAAAEEGRRVTATSQPTTTAPPSTSAPGGGGGAAAPAPAPTPAPPPIAGGAWVCPVQGARSFIDSWGFPRAGGRRHQGVDIMSPRGTPVVLPVSGRVEFRTGGLGGLNFRLNGDDGNWYYGAHLDAFAGLSPGHYPAGTLVGYVGDTGDARGTAPHLHFEIHIGGYGNPVNPYPTTARYC